MFGVLGEAGRSSDMTLDGGRGEGRVSRLEQLAIFDQALNSFTVKLQPLPN
jgi:hypothetical protein